jgi:hypothetical protein
MANMPIKLHACSHLESFKFNLHLYIAATGEYFINCLGDIEGKLQVF